MRELSDSRVSGNQGGGKNDKNKNELVLIKIVWKMDHIGWDMYNDSDKACGVVQWQKSKSKWKQEMTI